MDRLTMHSVDGVDQNVERIAALFPNCVTEAVDEQGNLRHVVDFDKLKVELGEVVEGPEERYQFTWPGKRDAIRLANSPIAATLRPVREDSVDFDNTQNLYIEGDNLDVLKLLRETYLGKVKMIYIDPPYNTGNDFVYEDDFSQAAGDYLANSGQYDDQGNRLVANTESNGRFHTDWLNMIYPRLKVARDLLSEDGAIFISIDDREAENLIKIGNEIFGEQCFVANISWQKTYSPRNDSKGVPAEKECIIVYGKLPGWAPKKLPRTEEMDAKYKNPDNDVTPWMSSDASAPGAKTHQGMVYAIQHPFTGELLYPYSGSCWRYHQKEMYDHMNGWCEYELRELDDADIRASICGIDKSDVRKGVKAIVLKHSLEESRNQALKILHRGQWPKFYFTKNGEGGIRRKTYLSEVEGRMPTNLWQYAEVGHTDEAKKELKALFQGDIPFDTPKPVRLLNRMLQIATDDDSLVLDFFSGSATTAHAVMQHNSENNGHRKFILVQIPEKVDNKYGNLCEIGKERIRLAGNKVKRDLEQRRNLLKQTLDRLYSAKPSATTQLLLMEDIKDAAKEFYKNEIEPKEKELIALEKQIASLDIGFRVLRLDSSNMEDVYYTPDQFDPNAIQGLMDNVKADRSEEDLLFQVMLELDIPLSASIQQEQIAGKRVFNVADGHLIATFDRDINETTVTEVARRKPNFFVMRDASAANDNVLDNFDQIFHHYSPDTICKIL